MLLNYFSLVISMSIYVFTISIILCYIFCQDHGIRNIVSSLDIYSFARERVRMSTLTADPKEADGETTTTR